MGLLRFVLATAVIASHSTPIFGAALIDGGMAVKLFFIISGFYMTLILSSKYNLSHNDSSSGYWLFISNRLLRIYPSYLVVLAASLGLYALASFWLGSPMGRLQLWIDAWRVREHLSWFLFFLSQLTIIGLDLTSIFDFSKTAGFVWAGSLGAAAPAYELDFLPQAWSVSVELLFYLVAPWICVMRKRFLLLLIGICVLAHLAATAWFPSALAKSVRYYFAPFQLGYLVLGVLAYRLFVSDGKTRMVSKQIKIALITIFAFILICYQAANPSLAWAASVGLAFCCVPFLFEFTRSNSVDKFMGDLSYPMYLTHILARWIIFACLGVTRKGVNEIPGYLLLAVTLVFSVALVICLEYPVDKWRQARVARRKAVIAQSPPVVQALTL